MNNILITGGAGFIGSNLSLKLIERGYHVTVLDNLSPQIHGPDPDQSPLYQAIRHKVKFVKGTVTSREDWLEALQGMDAVIHFAAETGTGQSMYKINNYVQVNIGGTALLLDYLANEKHCIKKLIVASSRAIYGEGKYYCSEKGFVYPASRLPSEMDNGNFEPGFPGCGKLKICATDEESKIHPSSVYGITKQNQEQMVMSVSSATGVQATAFRYQNVYGPGQSLSNPYTGILSIFSTLIKNGKAINIFEDGMESRDFVFIDDVVDATILGLEHEKAAGEIFNVGTGTPVSVSRVAEELIKNYGADTPVHITGNYRVGDIRHNYADLSKIKSMLGFEPKIGFEEGIRRFCEWVNSQQIQESSYEKSVEEMRSKGLMK